jgi:hypothetical protein
MSKTMLVADNVLIMLLYHIKQMRARAGIPKIVTADPEIWQRSLYALRQRCNSTLLHVFDFRRVGLVHLSQSLEQAFNNLAATGVISPVQTNYAGYLTTDYILRDELSTAIEVVKIDSTTNHLACYVSDIMADPTLSTDYEAMRAETQELAEQLLPLIEKRVIVKIQNNKKEG